MGGRRELAGFAYCHALREGGGCGLAGRPSVRSRERTAPASDGDAACVGVRTVSEVSLGVIDPPGEFVLARTWSAGLFPVI